jgi:hypothetical protein
MQRTLAIAVAVLSMVSFVGVSPASAQSSPEEIILLSRQAVDLANESLSDVVAPIGGLLGRISPSSSFASGNRGLGYAALSVGGTALNFEMTDPDYTALEGGGSPDIVEGLAAAIFADLELGLFSGYGRDSRAKNIGSVDLLIRVGSSLGAQEDLEDDLDLGSWAPIYGAGFRIGLLRGEELPSVSLSFGFNHFTERTFSVLGESEGEEFSVDLDFKETSRFFLLEVGKRWKQLIPFAGLGATWSRFEANYDAEVVYDLTSTSTDIIKVGDSVDLNDRQGIFFAGVELGATTYVRIVLEAGAVSGDGYATASFKIVPFPGYGP